MTRIIYKLKVLPSWTASIVASIMNIIAVIGYIQLIKELEKPANTKEAITFLFDYPANYVPAMILGIVAKIIPLFFFLLVVGSAINYFAEDSWYGKYTKEDYLKLMVVNVILFFISLIAQYLFIKYLGILILTIAIITFVVYVLVNGDYN